MHNIMIYESRLGISVHIKFLMEFDVIYVDWFVDNFMAFFEWRYSIISRKASRPALSCMYKVNSSLNC